MSIIPQNNTKKHKKQRANATLKNYSKDNPYRGLVARVLFAHAKTKNAGATYSKIYFGKPVNAWAKVQWLAVQGSLCLLINPF